MGGVDTEYSWGGRGRWRESGNAIINPINPTMSTNAMHSVHSMQCNTMQNIQHNALRLPIWFLLCCNTIQCINELMNRSTMPLQFNALSYITAKKCRVDSSCQHKWIYRALHLIGHWGVRDWVQVLIQVPQPASAVSRDAWWVARVGEVPSWLQMQKHDNMVRQAIN